MPKVPTYDNFTVAPSLNPNVHVKADEMPAVAAEQQDKAGKALMTAGAGVARVAADMVHQANIARVEDDTNGVVGKRLELMKDALSQRGKNALERESGMSLEDEYSEKLKAYVDEVTAKQSNDSQRGMFKKQSDALINQMKSSLSSHVIEQQKVFEDETDASSIGKAIDQSTLLWGDAGMRAQSMGKITEVIDKQAARKGWDKDIRDEKLQAAMSPMHVGILNSMIKANMPPDQIKDYYSNNSASMTVQARAHVQDLIQNATETDEMVGAYRALQTSKGGYQAQLAALNKARDEGGSIGGTRINGKNFLQLKQLLEHDRSQAEAESNKYAASVIGSAQDYAIQNPGKTILDWQKENSSQYSLMKQKGHLATVEAFFNSSGVTNPDVLFNVRAHWGDGSDKDVTKFNDVDLLALRKGLNKHDFDWTMGQIQGLRKGAKDPGMLPKDFNSLLENQMSSIGLSNKEAKTKSQIEHRNTVNDYAQQYILDQQVVAGRVFDTDETKKKLSELFAKSVTFRNVIFPDEQKPLLQTLVPRNKVLAIEQALKDEGNANPSQRDIQMRYWKMYGSK